MQRRFISAATASSTGDLDCRDVATNIVISDDDPNNFDGDNDGIGCETY